MEFGAAVNLQKLRNSVKDTAILFELLRQRCKMMRPSHKAALLSDLYAFFNLYQEITVCWQILELQLGKLY